MRWRELGLRRCWALAFPLLLGGLLGGLGLVERDAAAGSRSEAPPPARTREEALVELGRRLFFEPLASRSGSRSCASCHDPEHGFSDPLVRSDDDLGATLRHSQTILDTARNPSVHWDGALGSVEELVMARLGRLPGTKGVAGRTHGAGVLGADGTGAGGAGRGGAGGYGRQPAPTTPRAPAPKPPAEPADAPPGSPPATPATTPGAEPSDEGGAATPPDGAAEQRERARRRAERRSFAQLLLAVARLPDVAAELERAGRYTEAFQAAFDSPQVTTARLGEAIAAYCRSVRSTEAPADRHLRGERGALSESAQRGLALFRGRAGCAACHRLEGEPAAFTDFEFHNTGIAWRDLVRGAKPGRDPEQGEHAREADAGREAVTSRSGDRRSFKTPTLRDVTRRGPYMHDGSFTSLEGVVRYYAAGGAKDPRQDERLRGFEASDQDVADLVAFLGALTGVERPGLAPRTWHVRTARTRVRLLDGGRRPLAGLEVGLVREGDQLPGLDEPLRGALSATSDADGWLLVPHGPRTHTRLVLPDGLSAQGGSLLPDTSREAVVTLPVDGRVRLVVAFEEGAAVPQRLVAEHTPKVPLPGDPPPRTWFTLSSTLTVDGRPVASYEGWYRTDVAPEAVLRLPGDGPAAPERKIHLSGERTVKVDVTR